MSKYYESREDRSGKLFEHFLFGDVTSGKNNMRYMEALKRAIAKSGNIKDIRNMPKDIAKSLVKEVQVQDPKNPTRPFMKDVRDQVIEKLGLNKTASGKLAIYSSVGTPLDLSKNTQTDAFFEFDFGNGKIIEATLDATLNEEAKKEKEYNADILITDLPDKLENEKAYMDAVREIAGRIADVLRKNAASIDARIS